MGDPNLAVSTSNSLVRIYVLPIDDLLELAGSRVTRTLTDDILRQYLHVDHCQND